MLKYALLMPSRLSDGEVDNILNNCPGLALSVWGDYRHLSQELIHRVKSSSGVVSRALEEVLEGMLREYAKNLNLQQKNICRMYLCMIAVNRPDYVVYAMNYGNDLSILNPVIKYCKHIKIPTINLWNLDKAIVQEQLSQIAWKHALEVDNS